MISRSFGFPLFSLILSIVLVVMAATVISSAKRDPAFGSSEVSNLQDDRAADREAIRAHIGSIFFSLAIDRRWRS